MQSHPPAISAHRLARLFAWLGALLRWLAFGAAICAPRHGHRIVPIAKLRRVVANAIMIEAADLAGPRRSHIPRRYGRSRRAGFFKRRTVLGGEVRRLLKARGTFAEQVQHLLDVFSALRVHAARLARRRRGGFTRLAPILPRASAERLAHASQETAATFADTS